MRRILSISLDKHLLDTASSPAQRLSYYAEAVDGIHAVVPAPSENMVTLSEKASAEGTGGAHKIVQAFKLFIKVKRYLESGQFDLLTVQDTSFAALIASLVARKAHLPLEVQVHGFERQSVFAQILTRTVLKRATMVRVVSARLSRDIEALGIEKSKIAIAPIYARPEPAGERIALTEGPIILAVGRLVPVKNHKALIEAFASLSAQYSDAKLWIVGGGPCASELSLLIERKGLVGRVELFGEQADVSKFYRSASIFAFPSLSEGWGMVAVEAAGYGLPIVMSDVGCAGEFIIDNKSGLVVKPGDTQALADALDVVLSDRLLAERLGRGARMAFESLPDLAETRRLIVGAWDKAIAYNNTHKQ